jgi:hypothetical protein
MSLVKEMGISHREFFRSLPRALNGFEYEVSGDTVQVRDGGRSLVMHLSPEAARNIAAMRLPMTRIEFRFSGYTDAEAKAFLDHFDLRFRRGGG